MKSNVLLHIPHSSTHIPDDMKELFTIGEEELEHELLVMTDRYTDELFDCSDNRIVFPVSRLVCDVERFRDPNLETMTRKGMWVCYEKTSRQTPLKTVTDEHASYILENFYDPHHRAFTDAVEGIKEEFGNVIIVDCHSFSSKPLPYEDSQTEDRPDICIGGDYFHTSHIMPMIRRVLKNKGYTVAVNTPYAGTIVPMKFWRKDPCVLSIMLEINRSIYMDEATGEKTERFDTLQSDIAEAVSLCEKIIRREKSIMRHWVEIVSSCIDLDSAELS